MKNVPCAPRFSSLVTTDIDILSIKEIEHVFRVDIKLIETRLSGTLGEGEMVLTSSTKLWNDWISAAR